MANDYPLDLIIRSFIKRLHSLFNNKLNKVSNENDINGGCLDGGETFNYISLPYLPAVTSSISRSLRMSNVKISYRTFNSLKKYIKVHKDKLERNQNSNIIYKINCSSCDASYVGQSSRQLSTRISEHQRNFRQDRGRQSVVSKHRGDFGHDFVWNDVEILDIERFYHKRLISEMLHIKLQKNSINLMKDTELLDSVYLPLIKKLNY